MSSDPKCRKTHGGLWCGYGCAEGRCKNDEVDEIAREHLDPIRTEPSFQREAARHWRETTAKKAIVYKGQLKDKNCGNCAHHKTKADIRGVVVECRIVLPPWVSGLGSPTGPVSRTVMPTTTCGLWKEPTDG